MSFYTLGLIGYPLLHSLSPRLHQAALRALGLEGSYHLYPVPPLPEGGLALRDLLDKMRRGDIHGLNVTIPYKQTVLPYLDRQTPTAQTIGAVNTIFTRSGELVGDNTDAPGFLAHLEAFLAGFPLRRKEALLLGAGGAARAVAFALLQDGWRVTLAARRLPQAQTLTSELSAARKLPLFPLPLTSAALAPLRPALIINATPVGMYPLAEASPWPAEIPLPEGAAVYDLVYNPPQTALVRAARRAGLPATTGLGMLIEQAALAFERWTGQNAPRAAMRRSLTLES
jgi:shikimate dehydrogenase